MKLVITPRAEDDLANKFDFGERRFGRAVAERTLKRVHDYLATTLLAHPRTGLYHPEIKSFETWIPKTPFVVFYRLDDDAGALIVLAPYHHAQLRSAFNAD